MKSDVNFNKKLKRMCVEKEVAKYDLIKSHDNCWKESG